MINYSKSGIKITNSQYDDKLLVNNLFTRVDDYINSNTAIGHKCTRCDKIYNKKPKQISKLICKCVERESFYIKSISDKDILLIGTYINARTKIEHLCKKCDLRFLSTPKTISNSVNGCPSCSGKKFSIETYKKMLPDNIILLDSVYDGSNKKAKHKCTICDNVWETKPNHIIHMGCGCPNCSSSKGENMIKQTLDNIGLSYIKEKSINIDGVNYRFDFYIDDIDLFIEYDGIQHYLPIDHFGGYLEYEKIVNRDKIKNDWISENKHKILRISYKDDIEYELLKYLMNIYY